MPTPPEERESLSTGLALMPFLSPSLTPLPVLGLNNWVPHRDEESEAGQSRAGLARIGLKCGSWALVDHELTGASLQVALRKQ